MTARQITTGIAALLLVYSALPLLADQKATPDVCCSETGECPEKLKCLSSDTCASKSRGYCIPIESDTMP